ncbi:MAG: hypothetical protein A2622_10810 [Bdellovibrionales bacterium RIFCSPHIGHO2_01_FULL_40_29]|nr:MAG: hypothetical protein A2622_10810 [Bdellovibrionales bacterium RIFCSPHIGHO2_01_FULL_40_29]OFZ34446.1 MAG: hypothetical protein A3D17_01075 [Bdellovibrionales bacterium RIFCSPHIGHO2_02_FULL_40_15]
MKKILLITFFAVTSILTSTAAAKSRAASDFGLGIILGAPTGITAKYWLDSQNAIDGGLSFSLSDYVLVYGDYLIHKSRLFGNQNQFTSELDFYYGLGANIVVTTKDRDTNDYYLGKKSGSAGFSVRVPFGVEWKPAEPSIGIFAELVPGMSIIPSTAVVFQGGLGARYYFP